MTQSSSTEFAQQQHKVETNLESVRAAALAATVAKRNCDILLNNFQIGKKRYRVLLNYDHIVWEHLDGKHNRATTTTTTATSTVANENSASTAASTAARRKEAEFETEQLANRAAYGQTSNVLYINEIIRVAKGASKAATMRISTALNVQSVTTEVVAATSTNVKPTLNEQFLTIHYAERIEKSLTDCNRWTVHSLTLFNSDAYVIMQWHDLLTKLWDGRACLRVHRLLVFINPYGGRKKGLQVYERHCKPLFQLAGIDVSCIISQRANQIRDILTSHDLAPYDAVACVGGDGTVAEVINGLIFRSIHDLGMDLLQPEYIPKPVLPIAVIPAGSTDTIAYSMHGTSDVRTAAIHLILGQRRGLDVCSVRNRHGILRFCASLMSYGYLGDVAAKSEKYRWMGTKRYEYTGFKSFLINRGYEAELRMLVEDDVSNMHNGSQSTSNATLDTSYATTDSMCYANCARCLSATSLLSEQHCCGTFKRLISADKDDDSNEQACSSVTSLNTCTIDVTDKPDNMDSFDCDNNVGMLHCGQQRNHKIKEFVHDIQLVSSDQESGTFSNVSTKNTQDLLDTVSSSPSVHIDNSINTSNKSLQTANDSKWKVVKGKFFMICGANITCACSRSPNGMSRFSHLGDGHLDLILVRKTSLIRNVGLLINTMGRKGDIRNLPFVEVYRTRKFHFRTKYSQVDEEEYSIRGSCQPIAESYPGGATEDECNDNVSSWNCDGEVVEDLDIVMSSHCQLIDVFMRGPHFYNKADKNVNSFNVCCCANK